MFKYNTPGIPGLLNTLVTSRCLHAQGEVKYLISKQMGSVWEPWGCFQHSSGAETWCSLDWVQSWRSGGFGPQSVARTNSLSGEWRRSRCPAERSSGSPVELKHRDGESLFWFKTRKTGGTVRAVGLMYDLWHTSSWLLICAADVLQPFGLGFHPFHCAAHKQPAGARRSTCETCVICPHTHICANSTAEGVM